MSIDKLRACLFDSVVVKNTEIREKINGACRYNRDICILRKIFELINIIEDEL